MSNDLIYPVYRPVNIVWDMLNQKPVDNVTEPMESWLYFLKRYCMCTLAIDQN